MVAIIGFVSQKGGVGKSTLARAVAREAAHNDLTVKIADLDTQQGTSTNWHRRRLDQIIEPTFSVELYRSAHNALKNTDIDLLILDGPARTSIGTLEVAKSADLIVQPTGASIDDLEPAILVFHELIQSGISKDKLIFALSKVGTDAEEHDARIYISKSGYEVADGCVFERPAYRQAQNLGHTITETKYASLNDRACELVLFLVKLAAR